MKKLVLLRHGESTWNKENRFTGWTDVDLSPKGLEEAAIQAGYCAKADSPSTSLNLSIETRHSYAMDRAG